MKITQDLIIGAVIGAGVALLLSNRKASGGTPSPTQPTRKTLSQNNSVGGFYPRQAYVADVRKNYLMSAWYAP